METYDEAAAKKDLTGALLDYKYPGEKGPHYVVSIKPDKVNFMSPWPGEEHKIPPPPPPSSSSPQPQRTFVRPPEGGPEYRARKIQDGLYLIHWIVNKQIHVALLLDFVNKKTICAALMPGQTELFDVAYWDRWMLPSEALKKYQGEGHK
jgi:hypothetical protein